MSEVVQDTHQEFWRPPVLAESIGSSFAPSLALDGIESCALCGAEFMTGSRFCYVCGAVRKKELSSRSVRWKVHFGFLRILGFQSIKQAVGLPVPSLIGLLAGMGCVLAAVLVGRMSAIQTVSDFQGIQLLRIEWLLGGLAAFLAGILLKNASFTK